MKPLELAVRLERLSTCWLAKLWKQVYIIIQQCFRVLNMSMYICIFSSVIKFRYVDMLILFCICNSIIGTVEKWVVTNIRILLWKIVRKNMYVTWGGEREMFKKILSVFWPFTSTFNPIANRCISTIWSFLKHSLPGGIRPHPHWVSWCRNVGLVRFVQRMWLRWQLLPLNYPSSPLSTSSFYIFF